MKAGVFPFKSLLGGLLIALLSIFSVSSAAADEDKEKFNAGEMIFHHVGDSHEWHFATVGHTHVTLPLPVILVGSNGLQVFSSSRIAPQGHGAHATYPEYNGYRLNSHDKVEAVDGSKVYDLSITKNVASLLLSAALLLIVFISVATFYKQDHKRAPKGMARVFEPLILFIRDEVARPMIGPKADRFIPYLLTIFFFIWFNNLLGLLPGGANVTGNLAVTMTLAVFTFLITNVSANKAYWMHIIWTPGVPWPLKTILPIMPVVEFIGIFTKPVSLMIRLFANITAGHIIILSLLSLIFIFESLAVGLVSATFASIMNILEFLVAILQAYVFTLLSASYIGSAVAEHDHDHDHEHDHSHDISHQAVPDAAGVAPVAAQ